MSVFALAILIGLLAGLVRGGSLAAIGEARLRWLWLVPAGLLVSGYVALGVGLEAPWWVLPLHLGSYALLLAVMIANRRVVGIPIIAAGLVLNALVIASNGGLMPQSPQTIHVKHPDETFLPGQHPRHTKDVVLPREATRLWWLSDVLVTPEGLPVRTVVSVGDVILAAGLVWCVQGLMQRRRRAPGRALRVAAGYADASHA
jgi:hypothetical protein